MIYFVYGFFAFWGAAVGALTLAVFLGLVFNVMFPRKRGL
jgi:hypothetical protein